MDGVWCVCICYPILWYPVLFSILTFTRYLCYNKSKFWGRGLDWICNFSNFSEKGEGSTFHSGAPFLQLLLFWLLWYSMLSCHCCETLWKYWIRYLWSSFSLVKTMGLWWSVKDILQVSFCPFLNFHYLHQFYRSPNDGIPGAALPEETFWWRLNGNIAEGDDFESLEGINYHYFWHD